MLIQHGAALDTVDHRGMTLLAVIIKNMRLDCEHLGRMLVHAGYNLWKEDWLKTPDMEHSAEARCWDIPIPRGRVESLCNWLRDRQKNADRLANLCRISLRSNLMMILNGRSIKESVSLLPIPNSLKLFVALSEFM